MKILKTSDFNAMQYQKGGNVSLNCFVKRNGELKKSGYVAFNEEEPLKKAVLRPTKHQASFDYQFPY